MTEIFGNHHDFIDQIDVKGDGIADWTDENRVKDLAKKYLDDQIQHGLSSEWIEKLWNKITTLLLKQDAEKINLYERLKEDITQETREELDKEAIIHQAKTLLYEKLSIQDDQSQNGSFENFLKWIVDELVIGNIELAIDIWETNGQVIIDALRQLASWEAIKNIATSLGSTVLELFEGNAYQKWQSTAQLWLIGTGLGAGVAIGKKWLRMWIKKLKEWRPDNKPENPAEAHPQPPVEAEAEAWVSLDKRYFQDLLIEDLARLWDPERLEAGREFLGGKNLTLEQENALLEAHQIWGERAEAGIFNYTPEELKAKVQILKQAWFSREERRILLQNWICWKVSEGKLMQFDLPWDTLEEQVDLLYSLAETTVEQYDTLLQEVGTQSGASNILDSESVPLKSKKGVLDKIHNEYDGKNPEKIRDLLRWSIVYDDIDDLKKWLEILLHSDKISEIHVTDRLHKLNTNDILLNVRFPNGMVAEIQLHIRETLHAKETWYKLEKNIIDLDTLWTEQDKRLVQEIKDGLRWTRKVEPHIFLPTSNEKVSWHLLYEIRRSLWDSPEENVLRQKLVEVDNLLNLSARWLYTQRTWKPFTP